MTKFLASVLILYLIGFSAYSQQTISGKIKGENDVIGLQDVTILLNGEVIGKTDFEGAFQVSVPPGSTLVFKKKGFQPFTLQVGDNTSYDLTLTKQSEQSNGEVLSVGYGTTTKEESTGSIASIESEGLGAQPVVTLEQANQGRASGVLVQNTGGELGASASVRIRGGSSLTSSNQPLYVVDGVPLTSGNQSDINPNNIASIEVLKDASAAAIYGSRAANGVIIITTKSGSAGKMKIDADYQFGLSQTPKKLELFDASEHRMLAIEFILRQFGFDADITRENLEAWEAQDSRELSLPVSNATFTLPAFYDSLQYETDWQDEIFRTALSHRANLSLSGGSQNVSYFGGVSYLTQEGIQIGNDFERFNGQLNLNARLSTKLKANLSASYARTTNNRLNEDNDLGNPIQAIVLPPSDSYDPENDYDLIVSSLFYNPLTEINFSDNVETANVLVGSMGLTYEINSNLSFTVDGGIDVLDQRYEKRQGPETLDGEPTGLSRLTETNVFNYLVNGYFTYGGNLGSNKVNLVLGTSYQESNADVLFKLARRNSIAELEDLPEGSPDLLNNPIPGSASAFLSYFTRVNYTINDKYILQLSGRADGSSRFGEDNRYGFFPAVSAGWNISNESFMEGNPFISFMKLKASYGLIGNTPDGDFLYAANYFLVNYGNEDGLRGENLSNPGLKWETTRQTDVGVEFALFDGKVSGEISYYIKDTEDLLFPRPITQISGYSSVIDNVASMSNKGFEFNVSTLNVSQGDFSWSTDINFSTNTNEIQDLGGEELIVGVNAFLEGQAAGVFYLPEYLGVNSATGEALYAYTDPVTNIESETSDYDLALLNGRKVLGNPNPGYFGGITNNISYKNLTLSFLFQFVGDVDIYNATGEYLANSGFQAYGQRADQADRWYAPGDDAPFPAHDPNQINTNPSSRWLEDGSYIRLNNLMLTYNLPDDLVGRWGLRKLSLFVGGQNLVTFTEYKGYDPDVNSIDPFSGTIGQNILKGIDNFTAPQARTFTTGIKIGL